MQGPALDVEWRHRLENGVYSIGLSGIDQLDPASSFAGLWRGRPAFRGSAESDGQVLSQPELDGRLGSDRCSATASISTITGCGRSTRHNISCRTSSARSICAARRGAASSISQRLFLPADDRASSISARSRRPSRRSTFTAPSRSTPTIGAAIGGEVTVDAQRGQRQSPGGALSVRRRAAFRHRATASTASARPTRRARRRSNCLLRGIAGDYARATEQISWSKQIIDPHRRGLEAVHLRARQRRSRRASPAAAIPTPSSTGYGDHSELRAARVFRRPKLRVGGDRHGRRRARIPLSVRLQFELRRSRSSSRSARSSCGPNEVLPQRAAQRGRAEPGVRRHATCSTWSKFSGFDRVEGGTRANYGFQYTDSFDNGGHVNVVAGQSVQVAGQNSYTIANVANTGLESGLDKTWSNYVAGETLQPTSRAVHARPEAAVRSSDIGALARFDAISPANGAAGTAVSTTPTTPRSRCSAGPSARGPHHQRELQVRQRRRR